MAPSSAEDRPVYVVGDMHNRGPIDPQFADWLESLLDHAMPGRLILLGDLVDAWQDNPQTYEEHHELFEALRRLHKQGWILQAIRGNREVAADHYFFSAFPGTWHNLAIEGCTSAGKTWRIEHGDHCCSDPSYHLMRVMMRGFWFRVIAKMTPKILTDRIAALLRHFSRGNQQATPRPPLAGLKYLSPERCAARLRHIDTLIIGHVHAPVHFHLMDNRNLLVVSDWQPQQTARFALLEPGSDWHLTSFPSQHP